MAVMFLTLISSFLAFQVSILSICKFKDFRVSMYCCCSVVSMFLVIQKA